MSKAVLISIRPKWCDLIASGKKTIEVRKMRPKMETPFKCYIYCTKSTDHPRGWLGCYDHDIHRFGLISPLNIEAGKHMNIEVVSGKVIGEFVCHNFFPLSFYASDVSFFDTEPPMDVPGTCLTDKEIAAYLGNGKTGYGWLISDLVIYDRPRPITDFKRWNRTEENTPCAHTKWLYEPCETCRECNLKCAPQSWCYVEEV